MDDDFAAVLASTIEHEGGWVFSRDSNGAAVFAGVNRRANPGWEGWAHLPDDAPSRARKIDTPALRECVAAVYRARYWLSRLCEFCAQWPVIRPQVFDCIVNHGHGGAVERLQEACQAHGIRIEDDGKMGPATEAAIRRLVDDLGELGANDALVDSRLAFYARLAAKPGRKRYLRGWTKRAESYRA